VSGLRAVLFVGVWLVEVFGEALDLFSSLVPVEAEVCHDGAYGSFVVSEQGVDGAAWFGVLG